MLKQISLFIVVIALSIFAVLPLFAQGYFPMHDDTQVQRVQQMSKALSDGMFPVRWVADLGYGYGYPIFNFYAPFSYYLGGSIALFGVDFLIATKVMMGFGILLSGIGMYLFARRFFGKYIAFVPALFYMYAPYHAVTIYVRGAVGEYFAYAFIPFVFYAIWQIAERKQFRYVAFGAISFALVILSHNLTAFMITPFVFLAAGVFIFQAVLGSDKRQVLFLSFMVISALLLSAFYSLPVFLEMFFTNVASQVGGGANYLDHFVCLNQLWESPWGFGGSSAGCVDGLTFRVGKLHVLLALFSLPILFSFKKKRSQFVVVFAFWVSLLFAIFLTLSASSFIWQAIPFMAYIQYPWRFLSVIAFAISLLGGFGAWYLSEFLQKKINLKYVNTVFVVALIIGIIIFYAKLFVPQYIKTVNSAFLIEKETLEFTTSRLSDEYMPPGFQKPTQVIDLPGQKFVIQSGDASIAILQNKTQVQSARIDSHGESQILLATAYFPAWELQIDGRNISFQKTPKGLVFEVPNGAHIIKAEFIQTTVESIGNFLSIIGLFTLIIGIIISRRRGTL